MTSRAIEDELVQTRRRVVEAMLRLGRAEAPPGPLMQAVAREARMSLSTVYQVFEGKDHLLHEAAGALQAEALARTGQPRPGESRVDYSQRATLNAHEVWVEHPTIARLVLLPVPTPPAAPGSVYGRSNPFSPPGPHGPHTRIETVVAVAWLGATVARLAGHMSAEEARRTVTDAVTAAFTLYDIPGPFPTPGLTLFTRWTHPQAPAAPQA